MNSYDQNFDSGFAGYADAVSEENEMLTLENDFQNETLANYAAANAPQQTDDHFPRYAMSFLLPVSLMRQHGNNSYGDFNPKNENGTNRLNLNYFPPFALMPLYGGTFDIPYENQMSETEEPTAAAPFDYDTFKRQPKNGYTKLKRSAKDCSDLYLRETGASGGFLLASLTGFHITDSDKGLAACRKLLDLILPVRDREIFPVSTRVRNGVAFKGPFLDEMLNFVVKYSAKRIEAARLSPAAAEVATNVLREVRLGLQSANSRANIILNETEAEIRDPNGMQRAYTPPDLETSDAPVPTDLYCLAHTNRTELDDKQLRASENIGKGLSDPLVKAVNQFTDVAQSMIASQQQQAQNAPAPVQIPSNVMTTEQVDELLKRQREEFQEEMRKMRDEFAKPAVEAAAPVVTEPATPAPTKTTAAQNKTANK